MTQPQHELTETGSIVDIEAIYREHYSLFLRHYADLDYDQIGAVLGIARGTVAATLNTAHTKLRTVLGEVKR